MNMGENPSQDSGIDVDSQSIIDEPPATKYVVMLAHEDSLPLVSDEPSQVVNLRHPSTGKAALFVIRQGRIFEIAAFNTSYSSWFIDEVVHKDGSLHLTSPVDPVFLLLPYLIKGVNSKFMRLDQLVMDDEFTDSGRLCLLDLKNLDSVCDVKERCDLTLYRYNEEKTLKWLQMKVEKLSRHLTSRQFLTDSCSSTFVRSMKDNRTSADDIKSYCCGIVSSYLPKSLSDNLESTFGFEERIVTEISDGPPLKKLKSDNSVDDYSLNISKKSKIKETTKLSTAQKKLQAVDKSGMKSLSSFFAVKPTQ